MLFAKTIGGGYLAYYGCSLLWEALAGKKKIGQRGPAQAVRVAYENERTVQVGINEMNVPPEIAPVKSNGPEGGKMPPYGEPVYMPQKDRGSLPADLGLETITPAGIDVTAGALRELLMDAE